MKLTNAIVSRLRSMRIPRSAPSYSLYAPGAGTLGSYPTPDAAEAARARLPQSLRLRAAVYDEDGFCVAR